MNPQGDKFKDLKALVETALDGTISPEEMTRLNEYVVHNLEQRQYYCEYLHMTVELMRLCDYAPLTGVEEYDKLYFESLLNALILEEKEAAVVIKKEPVETETKHPHKENRKTGTKKVNRVAPLMAFACVLLFLFLFTFAYLYQILVPQEIATIKTSLNATFTDNQSADSGARLTNRKEPLILQTGLVEIVFDSGAQALLEAPATFRLKSTNRMLLYAGRLFASVPNAAQGFVIDTPNSCIKDLGTQFGVEVGQDGTSDLHMFKGNATLTSNSSRTAEQKLSLTAGQAKRVNTSGQVIDIPIEKEAFVRHFYSETKFIWKGQKLGLVNIVEKGNGFGTGQTNIYLDPVKGYTKSLYSYGKGNEYHLLSDNSFIDGLFIPDGNNKQIISSQKHIFADCPKTNGECYTSLGANPNQRAWATDVRNGIIQFEGQQYGNRNHPCLAMHANLGITFDLNAIRAMCPDIKLTHFVCKMGIADFKEQAGCNADFWILIDGKVRTFWRNVKQKNVLSDTSIELGPNDHFLTLVTTDGGDIDRMGYYQRAYTCDWCVFVEPALILETGENY